MIFLLSLSSASLGEGKRHKLGQYKDIDVTGRASIVSLAENETQRIERQLPEQHEMRADDTEAIEDDNVEAMEDESEWGIYQGLTEAKTPRNLVRSDAIRNVDISKMDFSRWTLDQRMDASAKAVGIWTEYHIHVMPEGQRGNGGWTVTNSNEEPDCLKEDRLVFYFLPEHCRDQRPTDEDVRSPVPRDSKGIAHTPMKIIVYPTPSTKKAIVVLQVGNEVPDIKNKKTLSSCKNMLCCQKY